MANQSLVQPPRTSSPQELYEAVFRLTEEFNKLVGTSKIENSAITAAKIASGAVTSAKILDGTIATGDIADSAITSAKIADGTIATGDIADSAITSAKIADGTIATADIADNAVTKAKISELDKAQTYKTGNQSTNNTTWTAITFDAEDWDTNTIHDNATNNTRFTCKTAGKYLVNGNIAFNTNGTGERFVRVKRTSGATITYYNGGWIATAGGSNGTRVSFAVTLELAVNDYIEIETYQSSGGALAVIGGGGSGTEYQTVASISLMP